MKKNKTLIRIVCIAAAVLLVLGTVAAVFAEEAAEITDTTVVARLNDQDITWGECQHVYDDLMSQYGSYYDLSDPLNVSLFRAVALEEVIYEKDLALMIEANGLTITEEEKAAAVEEANAIWEQNIEMYISSNYSFTEETSEEEKAAARAAAEDYFLQNYGYTKESYAEYIVNSTANNKLFNFVCKDITVSDEEVTASRAATVADDQALYENDLEGYCNAAYYAQMMAYYGYEAPLPAYRPAGFRGVKHILLPVDETIMSAYTDTQAAYEEQQSTLEAGEALDADTVPVTEEDVATAEALVLASVAETVEKINQRYNVGEEFDNLINAYSKDTNVVMEVCAYTSNYYQSFTDAAMAIANKGELSAPAVTPYGVHVILYYEDIPAGPIELTDAEYENLRSSLLEEKQSNAFSAAVAEFNDTQKVEYLIPNYEEAQAMIDVANAEKAPAEEAPVEEAPAAEEAPAEEPAA